MSIISIMLMTFVVVIVIAAIPSLVLWKLVSIFSLKKYARVLAATALPIFFLWDVLPGYAYFKLLCGTKAGVTVNRVVNDVRGIAIDHMIEKCRGYCDILLGLNKFEFIEADSQHRHYIPKKLSRYHLVSSPSNTCKFYKDFSYFDNGRLLLEHVGNQSCIVNEKIKSFSTPYILKKNVAFTESFAGLPIGGAMDQIVDNRSNSVLGYIRVYNFSVGWFYKTFLNISGVSPAACSGDAETIAYHGGKYKDLVTQVLQPINLVSNRGAGK